MNTYKTGIQVFLKMMVTLLSACLFLASCDNSRPSDSLSITIPEIDYTREVKILTAFFGLDNSLPRRARLLYRNAVGQDGMPLVFSHELDPTTLDGSDFEVTSLNGEKFEVEFATLRPANEKFELRTVLLIGEYGNFPDNPPISVSVIGDLMSRTGHNLKGQSINVIPLDKGPVLSYAEFFTLTDDYPYVSNSAGCDCPKDSTKTVVKAVWSGGVRALNGDELGPNDITSFQVTLVQGKDTTKVNPFQLADLADNDNNIDLCIKEAGLPILVEVSEDTAIDPRNDKNPKTSMHVISRW